MHKDTRHETFNQRIYLYCILYNSMSCDIYNFPWIIFAQIFTESSITDQNNLLCSSLFLRVRAVRTAKNILQHEDAWTKSSCCYTDFFSCRIIDSLFVSVQCLIIKSIFQIVLTNTYCLRILQIPARRFPQSVFVNSDEKMIGCVSNISFIVWHRLKKMQELIFIYCIHLNLQYWRGEINCDRAACKKKNKNMSITSYKRAHTRTEHHTESRIQIQTSWDAKKRKRKQAT